MKRFTIVGALTLLCSLSLRVSLSSAGIGIPTGCGNFPGNAAGAATSFFPAPFGGSSSDCPQLCDKWVTMCKGWASEAAGCQKGSAMKYIALQKANCETLSTPGEQKECKASFSNALDFFKGIVMDDLNEAKDFCADQEAACVTVCGGGS